MQTCEGLTGHAAVGADRREQADGLAAERAPAGARGRLGRELHLDVRADVRRRRRRARHLAPRPPAPAPAQARARDRRAAGSRRTTR